MNACRMGRQLVRFVESGFEKILKKILKILKFYLSKFVECDRVINGKNQYSGRGTLRG